MLRISRKQMVKIISFEVSSFNALMILTLIAGLMLRAFAITDQCYKCLKEAQKATGFADEEFEELLTIPHYRRITKAAEMWAKCCDTKCNGNVIDRLYCKDKNNQQRKLKLLKPPVIENPAGSLYIAEDCSITANRFKYEFKNNLNENQMNSFLKSARSTNIGSGNTNSSMVTDQVGGETRNAQGWPRCKHQDGRTVGNRCCNMKTILVPGWKPKTVYDCWRQMPDINICTGKPYKP